MTRPPPIDDFMSLAGQLRDLLKEERERGDVGHYYVEGCLARVKDVHRLVVVGDIHGDYGSFRRITSNVCVGGEVPEGVLLVFLGDYIDRGYESPHVVYELFKLKTRNPSSTLLLRGNHEGPPELPVYPHDFPMHLDFIYGDRARDVYDLVMSCFDYFYYAALLEGSLFMVHGGPPTELEGLKELVEAHKNIHIVEELLWNDPMDESGRVPSPRGAGYLFGPDVTERVLKIVGAKVLVRSHEPCDEGFEVKHNGRLITIFSRKGYPYFNRCGAYLDIEEPLNVKDAYQLAENFIRVI